MPNGLRNKSSGVLIKIALAFAIAAILLGCQQKNSFDSCVDYYRTEAGKRLDEQIRSGISKPISGDERTKQINVAADFDIRSQCKVGT